MEKIKPISPNDPRIRYKTDELSDAIKYINEKLRNMSWHDQIHPVENYHAIILSPYGKYISLMDNVVIKFKNIGWDCKWGSAYDVRGPHYCFYINKKHFV